MIRAAPFSLRTSAYPVVRAQPCEGKLIICEPGGCGGGGKRGFSFRPPGGSLGHFPTGSAAFAAARCALPVTSTAPRAACWPGGSTQDTWTGGPAVGAGARGVGWGGGRVGG